ncbi:cadmium resistance protein CadD [Suicoccus acidiformans]|uniref:Cadmium resistance protein CadD n=1 Tax=Suicoccus acidiformans TaxID=2036206 RepID=A0A347WM59_9LACT|nr:CadD family cadmium resistance transporter [Suicoccus acidiformans]AXY26166.1 cadmium resistance protein CadD [Suicoccus acidiformans]
MELILSAILVFISTSIDYLVVLTLIFSTISERKHRAVYLGQYLGTAVLVSFSALAASMLNFIPQDWLIGFLGLIPLGLGIRAIFVDEDIDDDEVEEQLASQQTEAAAVFALTLALGGDNLGVYIPYFTGMSVSELLIVCLVFAIGVFLLCYGSKQLADVPMIGEVVERYEKVIVPVVFIGLGLYIMWENGTFQYMWQWLQ